MWVTGIQMWVLMLEWRALHSPSHHPSPRDLQKGQNLVPPKCQLRVFQPLCWVVSAKRRPCMQLQLLFCLFSYHPSHSTPHCWGTLLPVCLSTGNQTWVLWWNNLHHLSSPSSCSRVSSWHPVLSETPHHGTHQPSPSWCLCPVPPSPETHTTLIQAIILWPQSNCLTKFFCLHFFFFFFG